MASTNNEKGEEAVGRFLQDARATGSSLGEMEDMLNITKLRIKEHSLSLEKKQVLLETLKLEAAIMEAKIEKDAAAKQTLTSKIDKVQADVEARRVRIAKVEEKGRANVAKGEAMKATLRDKISEYEVQYKGIPATKDYFLASKECASLADDLQRTSEQKAELIAALAAANKKESNKKESVEWRNPSASVSRKFTRHSVIAKYLLQSQSPSAKVTPRSQEDPSGSSATPIPLETPVPILVDEQDTIEIEFENSITEESLQSPEVTPSQDDPSASGTPFQFKNPLPKPSVEQDPRIYDSPIEFENRINKDCLESAKVTPCQEDPTASAPAAPIQFKTPLPKPSVEQDPRMYDSPMEFENHINNDCLQSAKVTPCQEDPSASAPATPIQFKTPLPKPVGKVATTAELMDFSIGFDNSQSPSANQEDLFGLFESQSSNQSSAFEVGPRSLSDIFGSAASSPAHNSSDRDGDAAQRFSLF